MSAYWIQTFTGKRFDLLEPSSKDVDILDIAAALARTPRFAGHTSSLEKDVFQRSLQWLSPSSDGFAVNV